MDPTYLIPAFPSSDISKYMKNKHVVHVYVDLKNAMTSLFIKEVSDNIVSNSEINNITDSTIFQSCLYYSAYWKNYCSKMGLDCKVFFCTDVGKSMYHRSILKSYKHRRDITDTSAIGIIDIKLKEIRDKNFLVSDNIINRLRDVYFFTLRYLESDFLPHYLIYHKFKEVQDCLHVIVSSDKDLMQSLTHPNIIMISKSSGVRHVTDYTSFLHRYAHTNSLSENVKENMMRISSELDSKLFPFIMSVVGDDGDDIPGIKGIGPMKSIKMFHNNEKIINGLLGDIDSVRDRVHNGGKIFHEDKIRISDLSADWRKAFLENDLITQAFKLIDFEMLIKWLHNNDMTEKKVLVDYINNVIDKKEETQIPSISSFMLGVKNIRDFNLHENSLKPLFE